MTSIMAAKRINLIGALFLCALSPLFAAENHWTGAGANSCWTNQANWSLGIVPDLTQDVVIDQTGTTPIILNVPAEILGFRLGTTGTARLSEAHGSPGQRGL